MVGIWGLTPYYASDAIFLEDPPRHLFHYTTQGGLLEILKSGVFWASDVRYLNDRMEFLHGAEIARPLMHDAWQQVYGATGHDSLDAQLNEAVKTAAIYVTSFSTESDDLSQWRAYSGEGTGYAIELDGNNVKAVAGWHGGIFAKCLYDVKHQQMFVRGIGALLMDARMAEPPEEVQKALIFHTLRIAPLFKHDKFRAESEWRVILSPPLRETVSTGFHHKRSMLVPHVAFGWSTERTPVSFERIVVGPCSEPELCKASASAAFAKYVPKACHEVTNSDVPYRNW